MAAVSAYIFIHLHATDAFAHAVVFVVALVSLGNY